MKKYTDLVLHYVTSSYDIERKIAQDSNNTNKAITELQKVNSEINATLKQLVKEAQTDDTKVIRAALETTVTCNTLRIEIFNKTTLKEQTYKAYRKDMGNLVKQMKLRSDSIEKLQTKDQIVQTKLQKQLTAYMHTEDAALINLLIAVSNADSNIHKKNKDYQ